MKKYLFMAVAAIAVLSSCSNDDSFNEDQQSGKAVQFTATLENDATTRTTLNGNNVNWASGDVINVNGSLFSTESTTNSGTFNLVSGQEKISGSTYIACYPSSMYNSGTISLPASYTYSAGQFNMPMYAQSTTTNLSFKNLCGVLAITVPSTAMTSVSTIVVSSDQQMNGAFTATEAGVLTFTSKTLTSTDKKVTLDFSSAETISDSKTFYLPVPAGSHTLKVEIFAGTTGNYMTTTSAVSIERNKIYSITFKANNTSKAIDLALPSGLLWATCNLGATNPQDYGNYYAWGETNGYNEAPTAYNTAESAKEDWDGTSTSYSSLDKKTNYSWTYYKWGTSPSNLYKYKTAGMTLNLDDDAAYKNRGGSWHMPTQADMSELVSNTYNVRTSDYNSTGKAGYIFYKKVADKTSYSTSDTHIFLPAAGYRVSADLLNAGSYGYYWSSSLYTYGSCYACYLYLKSSYIDPQGYDYRGVGQSVRPVCQ